MSNFNELSISELAKELENLNYEKLIKALFLFEKSESMQELNPSQIEKVLNEAYDFFINYQFVASFLQEDMSEFIDCAIKRELFVEKKEKSFER